MSDTRVEITGNIVVHHPVKKAEVIEHADWFNREWAAIVDGRRRAALHLMGPIRNPFVDEKAS